MSRLQYNQFGQLDGSVICNYKPYTGEVDSYTMEEAFNDVSNSLTLPLQFSDRFSDNEYNDDLDENLIQEMISFFDFCDYSISNFESVSEAYNTLYYYAKDEKDEAERELASAEYSAIAIFKNKMDELDIDPDIQDILINNLKTKGTAGVDYLEAIEQSRLELAQELLEKMINANWRHKETDYDTIRQELGRDIAMRVIYA